MNLDLRPINKIAEELVKAYQDKLESGDHVATGKLRDTLQYTAKDETGKKAQHYVYHVEWDGKQFILELQMQHYWSCLEFGTKPHMPPVNAILKWIEVKRIMPREPSTLPMEKQLRNLAWAMATKIKQYGTKKHDVLSDTLKEQDTVQKIKQEIASQLHYDIQQLVAETLTGVKGVGQTGYKNYRGKW